MKKSEKYEYTQTKHLVPSLVLKEGKEGVIYKVGLYEDIRVHGGGHDWFYCSRSKNEFAFPLYYCGSNTLVECYSPTLIATSNILRAPLEELQELRTLEWKLEQEHPGYRKSRLVRKL